jgi:omega-6 fatty acid desaturase (delta-12 desaturase)
MTSISRVAPALSTVNPPVPRPVPPDAPMPHRKVIRTWLIALGERSTRRSLALLAFDYELLTACLAGAVLFKPLWLTLICGSAAGLVIGRLFIIGHDACHQSLTPHRRLNKWLGRLAFLPSLTAYSLWDLGHNMVHHGFTNLKGVDFVWAPLTLEEFDAMPAGRRLMERIYRSGWGPGLYYMIEIWWKKMMFPSKAGKGQTAQRIFTLDCMLVSVFSATGIAALSVSAAWVGKPFLTVVLTGFVLPLVVWFHLMGFVIYGHHTHAKVCWHDDRATWLRAQPFVSTTVHLTFPFRVGAFLHHIMEHTAHHVDMSIPLYRLKAAQQKLEELLPGRIVVQPFSWRWYFAAARICKLYDFNRHCWTDFAGHATSEPSPGSPTA